MYSALSSIGKNLILLGIVALSAVNFFYGWFGWKDLLAIQSLAGLAYVFLSCYEFLNAQFKASLPVQRYTYFTGSYAMFKVIKIGIYLSFAAMLWLSGTRVKYLYPICLIIALTEGIVMFLKYRRGICFVSIYANYILFSQEKLTRLFAADVILVEFRHNILYFIRRNGKSRTIKLDQISDKEGLLKGMDEWIRRNKVNVSNESRIALSTSLTEN